MMRRRDFGIASLTLGAAALVKPTIAATEGPVLRALEDIEGDAKAELAYVLGLESYVYGFPLVMMDMTKGVITTVAKAGEYSAPINQLFRMRGYVSAEYKTIVRVSVNSVWSGGFLDLDKEPLVLSYPETSGRYFILQLLNMWSDDFASVGTRTTGSAAGRALIVGPTWNGAAPADIKDVYRCSTRFALLLAQMAAAGPQDFPAIHKLQDALQITPLSAWGTPYSPPDNVPVNPDVDVTITPYDQVRLMTGEMFFTRLARLLLAADSTERHVQSDASDL